MAKLIEDNPLEIPNTLIENQARNLLNNFAQDMQQRGVDLNKVEKQFIEMAYHNMRQQAERDVRGAILLDKISGIEKLEVSDKEVDDEIAKMADYYKASAEEVRESLEKQGGIDNIRHNLRTRKAIEAVVSKAKVTEGPWVDENAEQPTADEPKAEKKKKAPAKKAAKKS
jgi:trigger factor